MQQIIPLEEVLEQHKALVGDKASALAAMRRAGLNVPPGICVTTQAYNAYLNATGLRERISLEINRKSFDEMRWEEMWDAALRIRSLFINSEVPEAAAEALRPVFGSRFGDNAVVVRSSAPGEDSPGSSFAGLHESYVNVTGADSILEHVKLVWASLWSDAALLYRQELGLDVQESAMAVVVQEIVVGERSGVVFGENPMDNTQSVIEAVHGLNQGLVDGTVEPDKWTLDRSTGRIISHHEPARKSMVAKSTDGTGVVDLPPERASAPPLSDEEAAQVFQLAQKCEELFGCAQDVEWTIRDNVLWVLQSRPITSSRRDDEYEDKRSWYLSLRRSFENLKGLRARIEEELIPAMIREAKELGLIDISALSDADLLDELQRRGDIYQKWTDTYWSEFIPFAHGARLFGQVYNDTVHPSDPHEFMRLLVSSELASLERNRMLEDLAAKVRADARLAEGLKQGEHDADSEFAAALDSFVAGFGDLTCGSGQCTYGREGVVRIVLEMAENPTTTAAARGNVQQLEEAFLAEFEGTKRTEAEELLDLARTSYRLRDDDNIYLGRIEGQLMAAQEEAKQRIAARAAYAAADLLPSQIPRALSDPSYTPPKRRESLEEQTGGAVRTRQVRGQPAGPGIAKGPARVILEREELTHFKSGEILVCDALDPNMTFVVPLCAGIVERRGGMLIHGAIIAREYGLPCVTGVPDATGAIRTGDQITVDGYLGIITIA